jgi:hypothetical protein
MYENHAHLITPKLYEFHSYVFFIYFICILYSHNSVQARNLDNVFEWDDMSIRGLLFQWASTIKIQLSVMTKYKGGLIIISLKINLHGEEYSIQLYNKVCQWLATGRWFSPGTPVSSSNKTDH